MSENKAMLNREWLGRWAAVAMWVIGSALCGPAVAQAARSYAVLSLSADRVFVVVPQMSTGSSLDRNLRSTYPMPDDSMEVVAVSAAEAAIKQAEPAAGVELYVTGDPKLYALLDADNNLMSNVPMLLKRLQPIVKDTKATHLLLVSRYRHDAKFRMREGYVGIGKVHGVGFYVHEQLKLKDVNTGEGQLGFVGPYAALRVQLIDLSAARLLKEELAYASEVHPGQLSAENAWQAMPVETKVNALQRVVHSATTQGVDRLLSGR